MKSYTYLGLFFVLITSPMVLHANDEITLLPSLLNESLSLLSENNDHDLQELGLWLSDESTSHAASIAASVLPVIPAIAGHIVPAVIENLTNNTPGTRNFLIFAIATLALVKQELAQ